MTESKQAMLENESGPVAKIFQEAMKLSKRQQWYIAEVIANCVGYELSELTDEEGVAARTALRASAPQEGGRALLVELLKHWQRATDKLVHELHTSGGFETAASRWAKKALENVNSRTAATLSAPPSVALEAGQSREPIKQLLFDHFYTGEPGQHEAIETVTAILAPQQHGKAYVALRANLREAWAALAMIRETVETLAPSGSVKAAEHLDGPTFMHEADALVEGIRALTRPQPKGE